MPRGSVSIGLGWGGRNSFRCWPRRAWFVAVVAASGPVSGVELARAVGREMDSKNEVEKIRHRAPQFKP